MNEVTQHCKLCVKPEVVLPDLYTGVVRTLTCAAGDKFKPSQDEAKLEVFKRRVQVRRAECRLKEKYTRECHRNNHRS